MEQFYYLPSLNRLLLCCWQIVFQELNSSRARKRVFFKTKCRLTKWTQLTDYLEMNEIASGWLGADLALVESGIFELDAPQLQGPLARVALVVDGEPAVLGVDRAADAQDVEVAVADPGDLHRPLDVVF
jgi:hypothetical protein